MTGCKRIEQDVQGMPIIPWVFLTNNLQELSRRSHAIWCSYVVYQLTKMP